MRGIKPFKLGLLTRPFQWGPSHHLGVSALAFFRFGSPPALATDVEMWDFVSGILGRDAAIDTGIPKSRAEFLVVGSAHQPGGRPGVTCPVSARVGGLEKSLYVIGDRYWQDGVPTPPAPFTSMPLDWSRAYGGEGFDRNPHGKGFAPVTTQDGHEVHPLPNVEPPGGLLTSEREHPDPAGFGPLDFTWPQRFAMSGTYDKKWLETRFPGFAEDLDWRIWNAAAPDQQQEAPFVGDEPVVLKNLHPEQPTLETRLPGLRARCFVTKLVGEQEQLEEVGLRLMTVWLFPESHNGILVFQGAVPVVEDDARDVTTVLVAAERLGEPKDPEHYRQVLAKRVSGEHPEELLNDDDLMPPGLAGYSPEMQSQMELLSIEGLRLKRKRAGAEKEIAETRARLEALGLDPDKHGPRVLGPEEEMPALADIPAFEAKKRAEGEQMKALAEEIKEREFAKVKDLYESLGLDFAEVEQEVVTPRTGPPQFDADERRAYFRKLADELEAEGQPVPEIEHYATDPEIYEQWKGFEQQSRQSYLLFAHQQQAAPAAAEARSAEVRALVASRVRDGQGCKGMDLTGANLSEMDLSGGDFSDAFMESVNLEGARLDGARFSRAVLAHANLTRASIRGARFDDANLGKARLVCVDAGGDADLTKVNLWGADLTGALLSGVTLVGATLLEATLKSVDLSSARAKTAVFYKQTMELVSFVGAEIPSTIFAECSVVGCDFSGAMMAESVFVDTDASQCKFVNANLTNLRVVQGTKLDQADLKGANANKANFRTTSMREADLSGASLDGADLSEADMRGARGYRIVARDSLWIRTDLRGAFLVSANLKGALLQKADIRGTDLRGANLYGADFALVRSDRDTNVEGAIQLKVRTLPLRKP